MWSDDFIVHQIKLRNIEARIRQGEEPEHLDEVDLKIYRVPAKFQTAVEARNIGDDFPRHGLSYDRDNFDDASLVLQRAHTAIVAGTASLMGAQEPPLPPRVPWEIAISNAKDFISTTEFKVAFACGLVLGLMCGLVLGLND